MKKIIDFQNCGLQIPVLVVRKQAFCMCENKDADQLRGDRETDQRLCFHYIDSTIPLLLYPKFQASSHLLWLYSLVYVGLGRKPQRPVFSENEAQFKAEALWYYREDQQLDCLGCAITNREQSSMGQPLQIPKSSSGFQKAHL